MTILKKMLLVNIACLTFFLFACDKNRVFDNSFAIEDARWAVNDVKQFSFEIDDTTAFYNVLINVRNNNEYEYRNLYLFIKMTSPSNKYFEDTVEFQLADNRGKWLGKGAGNIWQSQLMMLKNVKLLEKGSYQVELMQGMRDDTLKSITDIGLRIETAI